MLTLLQRYTEVRLVAFRLLLLFLTFNVKKACQLEKNTLRNPCMESTSCGLDYGALPYKVIRLHVSLSKDESHTTL